jgi:hypothetical protein
MPLEIRELVIRTTFDDQNVNKAPTEQESDDLKEQIIMECIDRIMEILKDKSER